MKEENLEQERKAKDPFARMELVPKIIDNVLDRESLGSSRSKESLF